MIPLFQPCMICMNTFLLMRFDLNMWVTQGLEFRADFRISKKYPTLGKVDEGDTNSVGAAVSRRKNGISLMELKTDA